MGTMHTRAKMDPIDCREARGQEKEKKKKKEKEWPVEYRGNNTNDPHTKANHKGEHSRRRPGFPFHSKAKEKKKSAKKTPSEQDFFGTEPFLFLLLDAGDSLFSLNTHIFHRRPRGGEVGATVLGGAIMQAAEQVPPHGPLPFCRPPRAFGFLRFKGIHWASFASLVKLAVVAHTYYVVQKACSVPCL